VQWATTDEVAELQKVHIVGLDNGGPNCHCHFYSIAHTYLSVDAVDGVSKVSEAVLTVKRVISGRGYVTL